jgi:hypothetical protein
LISIASGVEASLHPSTIHGLHRVFHFKTDHRNGYAIAGQEPSQCHGEGSCLGCTEAMSATMPVKDEMAACRYR